MKRDWWSGPSNAIDRLIQYGYNAHEISWQLEIPGWIVQVRFARYHGQYEVRS